MTRPTAVLTLVAALATGGVAVGQDAIAAPAPATSPGDVKDDEAGSPGGPATGGPATDAEAVTGGEAPSAGVLDEMFGTVEAESTSKSIEVLHSGPPPLGMQTWLVRLATGLTLGLAGLGAVLAATTGPRRPRRSRG